MWEYLHHRNWQTLQIRAFFPPREPAVKHLPAHHCCQHSSCLSLGMTGFLLIHKFWFKYHLFRETFLSELTPTPVTSYCIIASFFRALISICNYPVCVFYGLVYCATSSREILPCLVYCCIPSIKGRPGHIADAQEISFWWMRKKNKWFQQFRHQKDKVQILIYLFLPPNTSWVFWEYFSCMPRTQNC